MKKWLRIALFVVFALALTNGTVFAVDVNVPSTKSWQPTGVSLQAGTAYGVWQSSGKWTVDSRSFAYVTGAGYTPQTDAKIYQGCKENGSWPYGILLGRINGAIFPIGRGRSFTASESGVLELGIHDNCISDNAGSLIVKVQKGLNVQGILNQLVLSQITNLSATERARLALLTANIVTCSNQLKLLNNTPFSAQCQGVVVGLLSLILDPRKVE
jgi:hypothetical protein